MRRFIAAAFLFCFTPAAVLANEEGAPPAPAASEAELSAARGVLKSYLDFLVKAGEGRKPKAQDVSKKLGGARKFVHPKTLELIAGQEKKGLVTNALAVWHWAKKDYWLTQYEITEVKPSVGGAVVAEVQEKNWRVEEGGEDGEPEPSSYLMMPHKGAWVLIDKRRNETFTESAIKVGYKEYFTEAK